MEEIGNQCFWNSEIEEVTLPDTLKEIGENVFDCCWYLKTVLVEKNCTVDVRKFVDEKVEVRQK